MSVIIELFDEEPLENVVSHLLYPESRLIFIGYKNVFIKRRRRGLERFLSLRGITEPPEYIKLNSQSLPAMLEALESVIQREPDCCIDLTGGGDLALVATGVLNQKREIPMYRINPRNGDITSVLGKLLPFGDSMPMTVRQLVTLHGGDILRGDDEELPITDELRRVVANLWSLSVSDKGLLNRAAATFNSLSEYTVGLDVSTSLRFSQTRLNMITKLFCAGLLKDLRQEEDEMSFSFKDALVKRLLTKGGLTLELMVRIAAEDSDAFSDVRQGIALDWDGIVSASACAETRNEVDVVLMRDMTPIFISCKNGDVKKEAFYELSVVAQRFGGSYAKKVLVCSALPGAPAAKAALRCRAKDMGITLIEDAYTMTENELIQAVGDLK